MLVALDAAEQLAPVRLNGTSEWGARIRGLRAEVWRGEGVNIPDCFIWDRHDDTVHHWVLHDGAKLLGAARLSVESAISDLPDASVYEGLPIPVAPPIASLNRLVVHPAARGRGYSRAFDSARISCARELGASVVLVHVSRRKAQLMRAGWTVVGEVLQPMVTSKDVVLSLALL